MRTTTHTKIFHGFNVSIASVLIWMHTEIVQIGKDISALKATIGVTYQAEAPRAPSHTNFLGEVKL